MARLLRFPKLRWRFRRPTLSWRLRFAWLFLLLLAAFVFFLEFIADVGGDAQGVQLPTVEPTPVIQMPERSRLAEARVLRVIDGDTIEVELEGRPLEVDYQGSHASAPCQEEATERNRELVEGKTVLVLREASNQGREQGQQGYVFTADGRLVDAVLIAEGLSIAWRTAGTYQEELTTLEYQARSGGKGCLWQE